MISIIPGSPHHPSLYKEINYFNCPGLPNPSLCKEIDDFNCPGLIPTPVNPVSKPAPRSQIQKRRPRTLCRTLCHSHISRHDTNSKYLGVLGQTPGPHASTKDYQMLINPCILQ